MTMSKRYFLELSYKGTHYHGWQIQNNAISVQEVLEKSLGTYFQHPVAIMGSGRTDTGVHASMQVCHFDTDTVLDTQRFLRSINGILPRDIAVSGIREVRPDAHARFDAVKRSYIYRVVLQKNPFTEDFAWMNYFQPNLDLMNQAAQILLRHEDFECFSKVHTEVKHFRCKIIHAAWEQKDGELQFHITANRFLRGMVRAIVGTLIDVGLGRKSTDDLEEIIVSKDRKKAGKSAPAKGLFLSKIEYPADIYLD